MIPIKWRASLRYLLRHPWQFGLSILGIALGVAVIISIDVANHSARQAFSLSSKSVTGRATDQIVGGSLGVPDSVYRDVKLKTDISTVAPVVDTYVSLRKHPGRTFHLLGVDPFSEAPFRPYLSNINNKGTFQLSNFITGGNTILLAKHTASELGVAVGDSLKIKMGVKDYSVKLIGLLSPTSDFNREVIRNLIITDISTAKKLTGRLHTLSHIDLILPKGRKGDQLRKYLASLLPSNVTVQPASKSKQTIEKLTRAFNLNLSALSMLGLVVGMFLIYNIMTFSVVQRHELIGRLRTLGMTRRQIFGYIAGEALLIGAIGTGIGIFLGFILAGQLIHLVTQTINDLYYVLSVRRLYISAFTIGKAVFLGIFATMGASLFPAYEATKTTPGSVLQRSSAEEKSRKRIPSYTITSVIMLVAGGGMLLIPTQSIGLSYFAILVIILGFAFLIPGIIVWGAKIIRPVLKKWMGTPGSLAAKNVSSQLSRTSVAIASLMIAVSATVGLGIMVTSFRQTLVQWLTTTLQADVYVSPPSLVSNRPDAFMDSTMVQDLAQISGVKAYGTIGRYKVSSGDEQQSLLVVDMPSQGRASYSFKYGNKSQVWKTFEKRGHILISEPLSYRKKLRPGDHISIKTPKGARQFTVDGVYYDYGSSSGTLMMSLRNFRRYWSRYNISGASYYLDKNVETQAMIRKMQKKIGASPGQQLNIRSNKTLRTKSLKIFDRTFKITNVLQLLVAAVAFVGIFGALMALELEKKRELGVMRAIGFTPVQVGFVITTETGLMGLIAGIAAIPTGIVLAVVLIYVINQRSFGWTLQFIIPMSTLWYAILLSVLAALLAGIYPSVRMAKISPSVSLREE